MYHLSCYCVSQWVYEMANSFNWASIPRQIHSYIEFNARTTIIYFLSKHLKQGSYK